VGFIYCTCMMSDDSEANDGAAVNDGAVVAGRNYCGPSYQSAEDVELCRAFIAASEDPVVGTNQKSADFKNKLHANYVHPITEYNDSYGTNYALCPSISAFNRFKKVSRFVLKLIGIEESSGPPPSGDTGIEEFDRQVKQAFLTRYPECTNFVKISFLVKPSWRISRNGRRIKKMKNNSRKIAIRSQDPLVQRRPKRERRILS
jgi:hypothetical protein